MPIGPVGIVGSSSMAVSLALACAQANIDVWIVEPDVHARARATEFATKENPVLAAQIGFSGDVEAIRQASLVFDVQDPDTRAVSVGIPDAHMYAATPFAVPLPDFAKENQIRWVPFQPLHLRPLTELTMFSNGSVLALGAWHAFAKTIGRVPISLPTGTASVGLHLTDALQAAADDLLLQGAILWELDEAMTGFGFDLGLFEAQDLTGLDIAFARRKAKKQTSLIADRAVQEGRIGKKIGWGWYRYPGGGGAVIDPLIEDLIREEAWFAKIQQRSYEPDEVMDHLLRTLQDALGHIRDQGTVSPDDLQQILIHGLGYPQDKLDVLGL